MIWYEFAVGRNHDKVEFGLAHWSRARPPAEMNKIIFFVEIDVAWSRFWDYFRSR